MFLTQRQSAALLHERLGIARRAATRLLAGGLAGPPLRTSASLLYERSRVEALCQRPFLDESDLPPSCAGGVLVARTTEPGDPLGSVLGPARLSIFTQAVLRLTRPAGQDWIPLVVTVHQFVVAGAELLDFRAAPADHPTVLAARTWPGRPQLWMLETRPPGPWFAESVAGRILALPPGNRYLEWGARRTKPPEAIC